jgi:hypothetical protein
MDERICQETFGPIPRPNQARDAILLISLANEDDSCRLTGEQAKIERTDLPAGVEGSS